MAGKVATITNTAGTKGVPRAEREAQILDVAAAEIARVGYAGLSLAVVAAEAGVSKPLVYSYFGTKDGLYLA
ncbi:TetR/AcrR family transcriptional regulator, partial [Nocardia tengchongensis]